jgi:hypothetical protein
MTKMWRFGLLITLLLALSAGCATVRPPAEYLATGQADPEKEQEVREKFAETNPEEPAKDVDVFVDTIPEGFGYADGVLSVQEGYQHQVLGKFELPGGGSIMDYYPWGFTDYKEGWRKGLCYWQVPLGYATLFVWTFVFPASYPCMATGVMTKVELLRYIRQLAKSAGGDTVIFSYTSAHNDKATGAVGFVIRKDPRFTDQKMESKPMQMDELIKEK